MDFGEVLDRMASEKQECPSIKTQPPSFITENLKNEHKQDVIE